VQIGAVTFGSFAVVRWNLNTFNNADSVVAAIQSDATFPAGIGQTATADGLRKACGQMFQTANGGRVGVQHVVIVTTDGYANINTTDTIPAAQACWAAGIRVYVIGMTSAVDVQQLLAISSPPQVLGQNYWLTPDYKTLSNVLLSVQTTTCTQPKPDLPGAYCVLSRFLLSRKKPAH
jgi:von Willebrand factor type A domain